MQIVLLHFYFKYNGNGDDIYKALQDKEPVTPTQLDKVKERVQQEQANGIRYITVIDKDYPHSYKMTKEKPPFVIKTGVKMRS